MNKFPKFTYTGELGIVQMLVPMTMMVMIMVAKMGANPIKLEILLLSQLLREKPGLGQVLIMVMMVMVMVMAMRVVTVMMMRMVILFVHWS